MIKILNKEAHHVRTFQKNPFLGFCVWVRWGKESYDKQDFTKKPRNIIKKRVFDWWGMLVKVIL